MSPMLLLLPIFLPMIAGPFLPLAAKKSRKTLRICVAAVTLITSAVCWALILHCSEDAPDIIRISEFFTLKLKFDGLGRFFAGIIATLWPFTVCYAFEYMAEDERQGLFFAFFTMSYGVTLGVAMAGNLFTLYCFYELLTLATVPLVHHPQTPDAVRAARTYFLFSLGGAAFAFMSMLYAALGKPITEPAALTQFFWLLGFFGFGVKAAVFPTYIWLPRASVAPTPVTALLHAVAVVKSGVFAVIRLTYGSYGTEVLRGSACLNIALGFALFTVLFGAVMALKETHLKRRFAYSTVDNLSYILFGVLLLSGEGLSAGLMHMAFHAEIKILAFFAAGAILHKTGKEFNREMDGMGRKMPVTFACLTVAALGLTGIPPLSGFVSKWLLLRAGASAGTVPAWVGCGVILVSALITAVYMLTPVVHAWFPYRKNVMPGKAETLLSADGPGGKTPDPGLFMTVPMILLAAGILVTGLTAGKIEAVTQQIARSLTAGF